MQTQPSDRSVNPIFIVRSSRSGTTMLAKMLGQPTDGLELVETHYFEQRVPEGAITNGTSVDPQTGVELMAGLIASNRLGYFQRDKTEALRGEVTTVLETTNRPVIYASIFMRLLEVEGARVGARHAVEQTPRNVYYVDELMTAYPDARFIARSETPRDVFISQKKRWRRRFLGARKMPFLNVMRTWVNYHPWLIARIWHSCVAVVLPWVQTGRLKIVRYEDVLGTPRQIVTEICDFLEIQFQEGMPKPPQTGSSKQPDSEAGRGIDPTRAQRWKGGGLNAGELALCTSVNRSLTRDLGKEIDGRRRWGFLAIWNWLTFPVTVGLAVILNAGRFTNLREAARRWFGKLPSAGTT